MPPKLESTPHYIIGELKFCSDPWPPYAGVATDENPGYIIEVIKAIYEPLGYDIKYENIPWSRCIRDTRDGIFDALAGADVREVPDFIFPDLTIGTTKPTFFTRSDYNWKYQEIASLEDIRLGSIQDYTYTPVLDAYIRAHQSDKHVTIVNGNNALLQLIDLLQANRIDVFVENQPVVDFTLSQLKIEAGKIRSAGSAGTGVLLYLPFSPKYQESRELVELFDRGIVQLRENGILEKILSKYQLKDWAGEAEQIHKKLLGSKN